MTNFTGTAFKRYLPLGIFCMTCLLIWPNIADADTPQTDDSSQSQTQKKTKRSDSKRSNKLRTSTIHSEKELENAVRRLIEAYQQEQHASALVHCKHAIEIMPNDTPEDLKSSLMMTCIELMTKNEMHEDALEFAQRIQQTGVSESTQQALCFMEATSLTKLHRWKEARQKYTQCPGKTDKEQAIIESNMAELAMIEGDSASAVTMYQTSLVHDDNNPHALFGLAVALAREKQYQNAHQAFLDGVKCDPGFTFLKDAFFEPKAENDFQTALRMYMARRLPEALFCMTRYTDGEQRMHYKALGQQWVADIRDNIANQKDLRLAQYPVLLEHVRSVALNNAANLLAFVTIQKSTDYDFITDLWLLDTETGKTRKRLTLPEVTIMDIAFVGDSNTLRLLGGTHRYELDAVSEGNTYYIYDNTSHAFPLFLTSSGQGIGRMRDDLSIEVANWREQNTALVTPLKTSMDIQQVSVRHDGKLSALVKSKQVFIGSDSTLVYPQEEGDWDTHTVNMEVSDVAIHPEKNLIALGMQSGTLLVDVQGNPLELYGSPGLTPISKIAFSPNGKKMAAFGAQTVEIWNVENVDAEVYTSEYTIDMCAEVPTVEEVESWNAESENDEKTE